MNSDTTFKIILIGGILLIGSLFLNGYMFYQLKNFDVPEPTEMTQRDTLYINDTIIREHTKLKYVENTDTCVIVKHDSITDTVYVEIPIEFKEYKDTIKNDSILYTLDINYHGYKSDIDNILILTEWTKYLITPEKHWKKFVGIGIGPGYSIGYDQFHRLIQAGPSVNVSLVFGFGYTWK